MTAELPPLPQLPVIRAENCDQEMTDKALAFLWEKAPALVSQQLALEPSNFDQAYLTQLKRIIDVLQKNSPEFVELPKTGIELGIRSFHGSTAIEARGQCQPGFGWILRFHHTVRPVIYY